MTRIFSLLLCQNVIHRFTSNQNITRSRRFLSSFSTNDGTIYALSSGQGKCGVAVIRMSGERTVVAYHKLTRKRKLPHPRTAILTSLFDYRTNEHLDNALVLWFPAPNSFTGEDVCEFHVHGGIAVISAVLNVLSSISGVRLAEPGDFTKRAFLNNKLDLTEVEGLGDLIHAETEEQRKQALRQMEGCLSEVINTWSTELLHCLAHIEAHIDFGEDQHIDDNILNEVLERIKALCEEFNKYLLDKRCGERLRSGIRLVILGEPNVGKSSLLNLLTKRPAAIVSPIAGTTRDVIETTINIDGFPVILSDTAGLRQTEDSIEREGVKRAKKRAEEADILIYMVDGSNAQDDSYIQQNLKDIGTNLVENTIVVINKSDLMSNRQENIIKKTFGHKVVLISCATQAGLDEFLIILRNNMRELCLGDCTMFSPTLTQERHRIHITKCLEDMQNAAVTIHQDVVITADYLRFAMNQLGKLTGKIGAEDILDVIFKDFCIGK